MPFWRKNSGKQGASASSQSAEAQGTSVPNKPAEDPTIERTYSGAGTLLKLVKMNADATIETGPYEQLTATVSGPRSIVDKIIVDTSEGLAITCPEPWQEVLDFGHVNSLKALMQVPRLVVKLNAAMKVARLKVCITVPEGTSLWLDDQRGSLNASGSYGDVSASAGYSTQLRFARITNLDLNADSSTVVTVEQLEGTCNATLAYSCRLTVPHGVIESADITADSSCKVVLGATCRDVEYDGAYNSTLEAARITGMLRAGLDSSSTATIHFEEAAQCSITAAYNCEVTATGVVREVALKLDSSVVVAFGAVPDKLKARLGYSSSVATRAGSGTNQVDIKADSSCTVSLIGTITRGTIRLTYGSRLRVGELMREVQFARDSNSSVETGYFAS